MWVNLTMLNRHPDTDISIRPPSSDSEFAAYYDLRWQILREPLGMPRGSEKDDKEAESAHAAAFKGEQVVGVGRLHANSENEGQIRYMATDSRYRGFGIGSLIVHALEVEGRRRGLRSVVLDARDTAIDFYLKNGYQIKESFVHATGLPCKKMEKIL